MTISNIGNTIIENQLKEEIGMIKTKWLKFFALVLVLLLSLSLFGCMGSKSKLPTKTAPTTNQQLTISTTTSVNDSGLLNKLKPEFEKEYKTKLKVLSLGSGQAIQQAERGNSSATLTHDESAEIKFVNEGYAKRRYPVMANYFVLVGPPDDPAKIKGQTIVEALRRISNTKSPFVSRQDNSGTSMKEKSLWRKARITPGGNWYIKSGSGMGQTLLLANEKRAYTLTDKPTFLVMKKKDKLANLKILVNSKERDLLNVYSVMAVSPQKVRGVNSNLSSKFVTFMLSSKTQKVIEDYGKKEFNEQLFIPRTKMTKEELKMAQ